MGFTRTSQQLFTLLLCLAGGAACQAPEAASEPSPSRDAVRAPVRAGVEVLLRDSLHLVAGRRVGLVTNHTGVVPGPRGEGSDALPTTAEVLFEHEDVDLVALYGPEHGLAGTAGEGVRVEDSRHPATGLPVYSLYGPTREPLPYMLEGIDVLLYDIQDVGTRYYTYPYTMALAMIAAGERGIPFVVLDRPDPLGGHRVQGNVLDPAFASFVGRYPLPMRYGMTPGELARLFAGPFEIDVDLHVVPLEGWTREMLYDDTGLPWVPPSPNIPSLESALHYPGTCLFEGTNLSVGRGTDRAFQQVGAPWLDGAALAEALNGYGLPGVRFEAARFTPRSPTDGKHDGVAVEGVRLVVTDRDAYDPTVAGIAALLEARRASGAAWEWRPDHFDRLAGTDRIRLMVEADPSPRTLGRIVSAWERPLDAFQGLRELFLLY